jgi:hypothetical protein
VATFLHFSLLAFPLLFLFVLCEILPGKAGSGTDLLQALFRILTTTDFSCSALGWKKKFRSSQMCGVVTGHQGKPLSKEAQALLKRDFKLKLAFNGIGTWAHYYSKKK